MPTLMPSGGHGAETRSVSVGQRMHGAEAIIAAARRNPSEAHMLTDCLPQPLMSAMNGQRRSTAGALMPEQYEPPSLNSKTWCVRIRRTAYLYLRAFVIAQGPLADLGSDKDRMAQIAKGRLAAIDRQNSPDAGREVIAKAQAEVWWSALNSYPSWVIQVAFLHCNATSTFAPRPAEVAAQCKQVWEVASNRIRTAIAIVSDVERHKPEWKV